MRYFSICSLLATSMVIGNPESAMVSAGTASIEKINATDLHIKASDRAVIDWKSFSIAKGETTRFFQPSSSSIVLNRVLGDEISSLMGSLHAQGKVFLVNPHGMIVGKDAVIETAGFLMTTFDISNKTFFDGGEMLLKGDSTEAIVHLGTIRAIEGDVILVARQIEQHGQIEAPQGSVSIAAAAEVLLQPEGKTLLAIRPQLSERLGVTALENTGVMEVPSLWVCVIQEQSTLSPLSKQRAGCCSALKMRLWNPAERL
jgi:filamentous hemagglutinin family protein